MRLFKVRCCSHYDASMEVYVIARDPYEAEQKSLNKMREWEYIFSDHVSHIEIIATQDRLSISGLKLLIS